MAQQHSTAVAMPQDLDRRLMRESKLLLRARDAAPGPACDKRFGDYHLPRIIPRDEPD